MFTLKNNRLQVLIAEPGKEYPTSRFDRAGFITQVRLDDLYDCLGMEDMLDGSPSSGGMGLCSEIQCDPLSDVVSAGESFPKFGVGNLKKPGDEPYFFMNTYESEDYPILVNHPSDTEICFSTEALELQGYAITQKKRILLSENRLIMIYSLKNEGKKPIQFEEYCHNFISLNHKTVNSDYYLTIPCLELPEGEIKTLPQATTLYSDGIGLSKSSPSMTFSLYAFSEKQMQAVDRYSWKMTDRQTGLTVTETDSFPVSHVTVWSVGNVMSPEMFYTAALAPGEECTWTREWSFSI